MDVIILEINAHTAGHYSKELTDFANTMSSEFNSIQILTPFGFKEFFELKSNVQIIPIFQERVHLNYYYQFKFYYKVFRFIKNKDCILHVWGYISVFPLFIVRRLLKRRIDFVTLKAVKRERTSIFRLKILGVIQKVISNICLKNISRFYIVHNETILNHAIDIGIAQEKITLIRTGVETVKKNISKTDARKILNLDEQATILLFLGVIREEKGIYEILELVKFQDDKTKLLIAGENWLGKKLATIVSNYGVQDKVIVFDHYINEHELVYYFSAADINVIYHKPEFNGESGVLLKAASFGLPSITHHLNPSVGVVMENKIGEVCEYLDAEDFKDKVKKLLCDRQIYLKNINDYRNKNSYEKMKEDYLIAYKFVIR